MKLRQSLRDVATLGTGVSFDYFVVLTYTPLEDGTHNIRLGLTMDGSDYDHSFDDLEEAIDKFIELRITHELGFDYEIETAT